MSALDALLSPISEAPDWPVELPDHLSASQITMWQRCREQYRRRYVKGEKQRPGASMVWGRADHSAHETNFVQKITSGEDISVDDVKLAFAESFDREVEELGGPKEIEWNEKPSELKDAGVRLVGVYHNQVSPYVQPIAVERKFSIEVPKVPVPIVGRIDLETEGEAIERKTARASTKKIKPQWRLQGLLYQSIKDRPVDWHVSVKTKTPAVLTPKETEGLRLSLNERIIWATQILVQNTVREILAYWETFGPDEPWTGALSHDWACDYCGYRSSCFWWGN